MDIFISIILGTVFGLAASIVLIWCSKKAKILTTSSNFFSLIAIIAGVLASTAILFISAFVCVFNFRYLIVSFLVTEVVTLIATCIAYTVSTYLKK